MFPQAWRNLHGKFAGLRKFPDGNLHSKLPRGGHKVKIYEKTTTELEKMLSDLSNHECESPLCWLCTLEFKIDAELDRRDYDASDPAYRAGE